MIIPSHIKIKNKVTYEVVWVDDFKDGETAGECRYDSKQIALKMGQSPKEAIKTFCHEVAHAICFEREIKITHAAIYQLEEAVYYIIFHNKWRMDR